MKFKPEDFIQKIHAFSASEVAEIANELLQKHIATLFKVYCKHDNFFHLNETRFKVVDKKEDATHEAYLWDVKPIEKKECKHLFVTISGYGTSGLTTTPTFSCGECGVVLKPQKWEPV